MRKTVISASSTRRSRRIFAATVDANSIHPALEMLENEAYHAGYDVRFTGESLENATIELTAKKDADMMPKLTVWLDTSVMNKEGVVHYECEASFPNIKTLDLDYADSAEYWIGKWDDVARFITWLMKNSIVLDHWTED